MKYVYSLIFLALISMDPLEAMSETDELGHQLVDEVKIGHEVSVERMRGWLTTCSSSFLDEVLSSFQVSKERLRSDKYTNILVAALDRAIGDEKSIQTFHSSIDALTKEEKGAFIPLFYNYMIGSME